MLRLTSSALLVTLMLAIASACSDSAPPTGSPPEQRETPTRPAVTTVTPATIASPPGGLLPSTTPGAGLEYVRAPIEALDVVPKAGAPGEYLLQIRAALPNGCHKRGTHSVTRQATLVRVIVSNTVPINVNVCTLIYGTYDIEVDLGRLQSGLLYRVEVNELVKDFRP